MKTFIKILTTIAMSLILGVFASFATGIDIAITSSVAFVLSNVIGFAIPEGVLPATVVFKSVYEDELLKGLKTIKNNFLSRIPDKSYLLEGNTINYNKIGAKPNVLIDNNTYPIAAAQRIDEGKVVNLRKLTTEATIITRDEIHNLPYDKNNSVIIQHKEALLEEYYKLALYSFAPTSNASKMPVLVTTGEDDGTGRKRLTKEDLIKFRKLLTSLGVGECDLVLCADHVEDIMLWSQAFENQYHNIASGIIVPLYGFNIWQGQGYAPRYDSGTKVAYGAAPSGTEVKASVAYVPNRMFRAYGDVEMFFTPATARTHQDEVNFDAYFIAAPKDDEGRGAIISGTV